jgi:ribokinase
MVGRVGNDAFGPPLRESLESFGVDTSLVVVDFGTPSGIAQITVDATGQNWIAIVPGANGKCGQEELGRVSDVLGSADIVLLQLEIPLEVSLAAAQIAKDMGKRVILDPAPMVDLPDGIASLFDFIIPNEVETSELVGFTVSDVESAKRAAHHLRQQGFEGVVIKLGAQGCYYATEQEEGHLPGFPVDVVDTVAAGDAFNGAFSVALVEGKTVVEAASWGNAAGALSVSRRGAQASMPTREETETLLEQRFAS